MIGSFFTCRFLRSRSKDGRLALLLGSGLSSEVNIERGQSFVICLFSFIVDYLFL